MSIKVLVIDDSAFYRNLLKKGIEKNTNVEVVALAEDAYQATEMILKYRPNLITCDIEMPIIDGISLIEQLMPQYPIPIIVISSVSSRIFDAIKAGAVDYLLKTDFSDSSKRDAFFKELNYKIVNVYNRIYKPKPLIAKPVKESEKNFSFHKIIAIGASTGGTQAIFSILQQLPENVPPIVIVQHIPAQFATLFAQRLDRDTSFTVKEAQLGEELKNNHVYIAPGDKHLEVKVGVEGKAFLSVYSGPKYNGHCPSVDKLFFSISKVWCDKAIAILLTGMGMDGALGLAALKRSGSITIIQDEKSSVVYGMPKAAKEINAVVCEVSLNSMGKTIMKYLK